LSPPLSLILLKCFFLLYSHRLYLKPWAYNIKLFTQVIITRVLETGSFVTISDCHPSLIFSNNEEAWPTWCGSTRWSLSYPNCLNNHL
jgi:hypothetical protein